MSDPSFEGFLPPESSEPHPWQRLGEYILSAVGSVAQTLTPAYQSLIAATEAKPVRESAQTPSSAAPLTRHDRRALRRDIRLLNTSAKFSIPPQWLE
jgi:hypothetical protein